MAPSFARRIGVTAIDAHGELLDGAVFEVFLNGAPGGTLVTNGHGTYEVPAVHQDATISVSAKWHDMSQGPTTLAPALESYEFQFDVVIHSPLTEFLMKHFPAVVGIFFALLATALAFSFKDPTLLQIRIILGLFAIGGGGFGGEIAGFINANISLGKQLSITAGGAAAIFALLYFFGPRGVLR